MSSVQFKQVLRGALRSAVVGRAGLLAMLLALTFAGCSLNVSDSGNNNTGDGSGSADDGSTSSGDDSSSGGDSGSDSATGDVFTYTVDDDEAETEEEESEDGNLWGFDPLVAATVEDNPNEGHDLGLHVYLIDDLEGESSFEDFGLYIRVSVYADSEGDLVGTFDVSSGEADATFFDGDYMDEDTPEFQAYSDVGSGTITIDALGAVDGEVSGSFSLTMEDEATGEDDITLTGSFTATRECDNWDWETNGCN